MSDTVQNSVFSNTSNKYSEKNSNNKNSDTGSESLLSNQDDRINLTPKPSLSTKEVPIDKDKFNNSNSNSSINITKKIEKKSSSLNIMIKGNGIKQVKIASSKKRSKKNVCFYPKCTKPIAKFIGDCDFCNGHFCSSHRLMESHNCRGLDTCKEQSHQRNADKLSKERTIASKIQI